MRRVEKRGERRVELIKEKRNESERGERRQQRRVT